MKGNALAVYYKCHDCTWSTLAIQHPQMIEAVENYVRDHEEQFSHRVTACDHTADLPRRYRHTT
jgi:hypothetical protein